MEFQRKPDFASQPLPKGELLSPLTAIALAAIEIAEFNGGNHAKTNSDKHPSRRVSELGPWHLAIHRGKKHFKK